jgi:hypothetical protein
MDIKLFATTTIRDRYSTDSGLSRSAGLTICILIRNVALGRMLWQCDEEHDPKANDDGEAEHEDREAMHDLVVSAMDESVRHAQNDEQPRPRNQPTGHMRQTKGNAGKRVEQYGHLKEILEVVGGLDVLELRCHL